MNIKALITGLFMLGSTSAAMARPATISAEASWSAGGAVVVRDHREQGEDDFEDDLEDRWDRPGAYAREYRREAPRDHRLERDYRWERPRARPYAPVWTTLGTVHQIVDGEMPFAVSPYAGRISTLRLQSTAGKSLIYRVEVHFASGHSRVIEVNRYLTASSPAITLDVAGRGARAITHVTVVGRNARRSAFRVLAI